MIPHVTFGGAGGSGKSTVARALSQRHKTLWIPRVTTRDLREGEVEGQEYLRRTRKEIEEGVKSGIILLNSVVLVWEKGAHLAGVFHPSVWSQPKEDTELIISVFSGFAPLIKELVPEIITCFLFTTEDEIRARLEKRYGENLQSKVEMSLAQQRWGMGKWYDHQISNHSGALEECVTTIEKIAGLVSPR